MCPDCGEPLVAFELDGVEIDHCVECYGTWFDAGELEMLSQLAEASAEPLARVIQSAAALKKGKRHCVRCRQHLTLIAVGDDTTVELDHCPNGHGLWFDQGELRQMIAIFESEETSSVARFFAELYKTELQTQEAGE